jgi:RNA polymerase sigma-70 factor (ECF subfamily)
VTERITNTIPQTARPSSLRQEGRLMALPSDDSKLIQRCLTHQPGAWNDFVDQYLGLVYRIIHHTAHHRGFTLRPEDVEDLAADVLLQLVANNYAALRHYQGRSSLATYLTVICRRAVIHLMAKKLGTASTVKSVDSVAEPADHYDGQHNNQSLEQVHELLSRLPRGVREVVRMYYLEGRTYEEISAQLGIPVNSIGPLLSRARQRLRMKLQAKPAPVPVPPDTGVA